jgi:hypothetical protein
VNITRHAYKRHLVGFKKHKGEIMTREAPVILGEALEELADAYNYVKYASLKDKRLRKRCSFVMTELSNLYLDIEYIRKI